MIEQVHLEESANRALQRVLETSRTFPIKAPEVRSAIQAIPLSADPAQVADGLCDVAGAIETYDPSCVLLRVACEQAAQAFDRCAAVGAATRLQIHRILREAPQSILDGLGLGEVPIGVPIEGPVRLTVQLPDAARVGRVHKRSIRVVFEGTCTRIRVEVIPQRDTPIPHAVTS